MARTTGAYPNSLEVRPLCVLSVSGFARLVTPETPETPEAPATYVDDALFMPALSRVLSDPNFTPKTLVFFGGDVQNFLSKMDTSDPKINCHRWCLEAAAQRLGSNFPSHHIVVIRPSRTMFEHVNCYDNFVYSNYVGTPTFVYQYKSLVHLERLLYKISMKIRHTDSDELFKLLLKIQEDEAGVDDDDPTGNIVWQYELMPEKRKKALVRWQKKLHLEQYPLTLVAFSKGCVVLNQFLYEFHYARGLEPRRQDSSFIDRIEHMYWLDCGHPGRFDVYPTSRGALKTISDLGIQLHVHLSQYQMDDYLRPWIRRQCNEFVETLRACNAKLVVYRHESEHADLRAHWNVFLNFMQKESEPTPPQPPAAAPTPGSRTPSPAPRAPSPPAAPHGPRRHPNTPQERAMMTREILGLALVSPNDAPDLSLQLIFRRPLNEILDVYSGPGERRAGSGASASAQEGPAESSDASSPTGSVQPSTSSARNSSARSNTQSRSDPGEGPSSRAPEPSASASSSDRPSEIQSADGFKVLLKKQSTRMDFSKDPEAVKAFESPKYTKMETPAVATVIQDEKTISFNIYTPVRDHYKPVILDWIRPEDMDSRSATTPMEVVPAPDPSAAAAASGDPDAVPSTSRGAPRRNARNSRRARTETNTPSRQARISQSVELSSESPRDSSTDSDSPPRTRSRRVRRNSTPYARRGTSRYNLRSAR